MNAQPPGGRDGRKMDPKERANQQSDRMIKELDLSTAQGEKIKALNLEYAEKTQAAREEARAAGDRASMRETMKALRTEQNEKLKKYMTAEQVEKWEKILAERPNSRNRKGKGNRKSKEEKS